MSGATGAAPALRAALVVTGSELVRGDRTDRNGPFLAQALLRLGVEPAQLRIVGDEPAELETAIRDGLAYDLLVCSGGLGPTHDDRTIELLARAEGVGLHVDEALAADIERRTRAVAERLRRPYADFAPGVRKQASVPDGAVVAGIVGTAPAVVLDAGRCVAAALPGPPRELQELWPRVLETEPVRRVLEQATPRERRTLRFYGVGESSVAAAFEAAGGEVPGLDVTICAREFEIHVDLFAAQGADARAEELERRLVASLDNYLFSRTESPIEAIVLDLCRARGLTLATAESCTGGLVAARLTSVPGSSDVLVGGVVAYANEVKTSELGVSQELLRRHGAVSAEAAAAMAEGARARLGADVAVAVTGVAGPGGGTPEKPVGLVFVHVAGPGGGEGLRLDLPGDRATVRLRATVAALHLVRTIVSKL